VQTAQASVTDSADSVDIKQELGDGKLEPKALTIGAREKETARGRSRRKGDSRYR